MAANWFEVDRRGLAAILERRGKAWALFELVQNAWDAGATRVAVGLQGLPGEAYCRLTVVDDAPGGWADLAEAFTMFRRSRRAADAEKRGRFCLGEKLVLAICRKASIESTGGTLHFDEAGARRRTSARRDVGTRFCGDVRLTRAEMVDLADAAKRLIPPEGCTLTFESVRLDRPARLATFSANLPTEIADAEGNLRPTRRIAQVEAFAATDRGGEILELGIPVCQADFPWRLNVLQKIPLGLDRDSVTDAFRRALQVAAVNQLASDLTTSEAAAPWATEALADARIQADALGTVLQRRFGDRAVVATPGDPVANAQAEAYGCQVIHGGALPAEAWANVRKHKALPTTSTAFPTPKPAAKPEGAPDVCPLCKQPITG